MANVAPPHLDFRPHPIHHAPPPFGFGFGRSATSSTSSTAMNTPWNSLVAPAPTASTSSTSVRPQKRRLEVEDQGPVKARRSDDAMDRSPTPERPRRAAPKRARTSVVGEGEDKQGKENKPPGNNSGDDVDVGVLLASLPPQSLLPILTSLLDTNPTLKSSVLSLIPRPSIDTALEALMRSSKKLRDAYPYSTTTPVATTGFGFGSAGVKFPSVSQSTTSFGFGRPQPFGQPAPPAQGTMRDTYITSRLQTHITEFISACMAYLPYFSCITDPSQSVTSNASALQKLHKEGSHPSETYTFLAALTQHVSSQPPLTQRSLGPSLLPRLLAEWRAWVDVIDETVNRRGGMFGGDTVRSWESGMDQFAEIKDPDGNQPFKDVRDMWVAKVGWLVGRRAVYAMDE